MKKIMFFATIVAMSLAVAMPAQAQTRKDKKAAQKAEWEMQQQQQREEAELRHKMKMDSLRNAQKDAEEKAKYDKEMDALKREQQRIRMESKFGMEQRLEGGVQLIITPCMDEFIALNKEKGHMAAQGISTGQPTQEAAELNANRVGLSDITTRFLGVIKNGVEQYSKDTSTPEKQRAIEAQLEGIAVAVGEKAINELFVVGCRQFGKDRYNNYICYEALYVPMEEVMDAIVEEAVKKVDVDKALFRKRMQAELDANAARENESLQQQRKEAEEE
ncbi:MAG: hypothetical protein IJU36_05495 [Paludibacteraceae bacterium]|nr:hypothetical protein [Paludibacteraceae bacterium]